MRACLLVTCLLIVGPAPAGVFPAGDWQTSAPEQQGLSSARLDAVAAYAIKYGGGSGCVIRHGVLVKEWGDPKYLVDIKSATKGSVGTTLLGLAVDRGLLRLDDLAQKHYPALGVEKSENNKDWLAAITVRHLATMTAGFDDGRPPRLLHRPGTKGVYSNDTANMLAELLTLRFGADLKSVVKRSVLDPIGMPESEWSWRANQYRPKTIGNLPSREFASGIKITHRALARIGMLYLHEGEWDGKRILSRDYVRAATRPTDLPAPWPYYAFYWGSNARGTFAQMPKDTFWALGLGDSFVIACPSLDIVAVRLGVGSKQSQLPEEAPDDWGGRVHGFFRLVVAAVRDPVPPSPVIKGITWAPKEQIVRRAKGSDNWPLTWGDDDRQYTAYGDGNGFEPFVPKKLSLGFARITGAPGDYVGENVRSPSGEQLGDGAKGQKASGILMADGVLYLWVRNAGNSQLAWSTDHGVSWQWADWKFATSFGCPTFLNFSANYAGARDSFVYVFSHDHDSAYLPADGMVMTRVPIERLRDRSSYEFFAGVDLNGTPVWSSDVARRAPVFKSPGRCYRSGVTYNAELKRYLWCQTLPGTDARFRGGFGIYDAPEPWGPWTTVYFTEEWDVGPGETSSFPTKWMSGDGRTLHLVFSGEDSFSIRQATLQVTP